MAWLSVFLLIAFTANAQNVTITGRVNKPNALVRLFVYDDLFNWKEAQSCQMQANEKGQFILEVNIDQILPARIYVDLENVDLYLSPNSTYDVEIFIPQQDEAVSYFDKEMPALRVRKANDKDIYRQLTYSEKIINGYLLNHFNQIYRGRQSRYIDSIRTTIAKTLPNIKSQYVKDYNEYKIAAIKNAIYSDGGKKISEAYFDNKPVLYTQPAYIDLFKEMFSNYFWRPQYDVEKLQTAFLTGSIEFKNYLATDPLLARNPRLAELIAIYNLQKIYYQDASSRKRVVAHLIAIQEDSKYSEHKCIISNAMEKFNRFKSGAPATDFELKNSSGAAIKLSQYNNRRVLLQFVDDASVVSERQFKALNELHKQWHDSVQIVTIATKDKMDFYKKQFSEKKYDWPLLNLGNNILLLEAYDVKMFPEYVLILPGTKIGAAPAPSPDQDLDVFVRKTYRK